MSIPLTAPIPSLAEIVERIIADVQIDEMDESKEEVIEAVSKFVKEYVRDYEIDYEESDFPAIAMKARYYYYGYTEAMSNMRKR